MAARAIIADHQMMFTEGLQAILSDMKQPPVKIVGIANSLEEMENFSDFSFDLLIFEVAICSKEGFSFLSDLKKGNPALKIIVLSSYSEPSVVRDAFLKGVDGYVLKSNQTLEFFECIEDVMNGKTYLAEGLRLTPEKVNTKKNIDPLKSYKIYEDRFLLKQKLSKRETQVLTYIVQAKSTKEIAEELYISDQTVSAHRKSIMRKLGTKSTVTLIKFALEHQLV